MKKHIIAVLCILTVSALAGALFPGLAAADSVALAVIAFAVYAAVCHVRHRKKGGCSSCGGCSGCAYQGDCENGSKSKLQDTAGKDNKESGW
ncbi:MAG: FeoB-associated Cys-rich membrane protein [Oscillospiraceae bacterium]|nr:FeoB-associated Cys-rich membrane protein [Oscillospiraceae bacterium]